MAHDEIKHEAAERVASVNGMPPQLAAEFGRKVLFVHERPTFNELKPSFWRVKHNYLVLK